LSELRGLSFFALGYKAGFPIVERRLGFDYFGELYGSYPFPCVLSWNEAPSLIDHIRSHGLEDSVIASCHSWRRSYKATLRERIAASVHTLLAAK
jgi:hypothetical protein